MELREGIWVGICCGAVLLLGACFAIGVLAWAVRSIVAHVMKAEARSREMAMAVIEDWREVKRLELDVAKEGASRPPETPSNDFPEELLPPLQS